MVGNNIKKNVCTEKKPVRADEDNAEKNCFEMLILYNASKAIEQSPSEAGFER